MCNEWNCNPKYKFRKILVYNKNILLRKSNFHSVWQYYDYK